MQKQLILPGRVTESKRDTIIQVALYSICWSLQSRQETATQPKPWEEHEVCTYTDIWMDSSTCQGRKDAARLGKALLAVRTVEVL